MKLPAYFFAFALLTAVPATHSAVHLSPSKTGQAIIVPFYTVSNQMNTLLSLNNTTGDNKAVKIHFKEAKSGDLLASFNVYLTDQDMWTMAAGQSDGKIKMVSNDQTCTAGFPNNEDIATESDWLWQNGTIEIIEMAVLDHIEAPFSYRNCNHINETWQPSENFISPASGGLHAEVTLMDVEQGHSANIPIIHMDGFYGNNNIQYTAAGESTPNLSTGTKDSLVLTDGKAIKTTWPTGYEAVSALLMHNSLINEFNLEDSVAAQTEWIVSFPTFFYHANAEVNKPFLKDNLSNNWYPDYFILNFSFFDRETNNDFYTYDCGVAAPCPDPNPITSIGHSVVNFIFNSSTSDPRSSMLTSISNNNTDSVFLPRQQQPWLDQFAGKLKINLNFETRISEPNNRGHDSHNVAITHEYHGLPFVGFAYSKLTNANAQPDLLAQYAFVREHFGEKKILTGVTQ